MLTTVTWDVNWCACELRTSAKDASRRRKVLAEDRSFIECVLQLEREIKDVLLRVSSSNRDACESICSFGDRGAS